MAGYGAVVSLLLTVDHLLQPSRISLDPPSAAALQLLYWKLDFSLREILERLDDISPSKSRKEVNALDGQIKEAVWRFEDFLESHLSDQILSHHFERESHRVWSISKDVITSFIKTVGDMKNKYIHELDNMPQVEDDEVVNASTSRSSSLGGMKAKMVGFSHLFERVKRDLMERYGDIFLFKLVGMPGSGKTTLAQNLFEDPAIVRWFDYRVWITVGRRYKLNEIERRVLAQLNPQIDEIIPQAGDEGKHKHLNRVWRWADRRLVKMKIGKYLRGGKRCLIVLDNIWDTEVIEYFKTLLQVENVVIQILLTTNQDKVAQQADRITKLHKIYTHMMEPLNEKESEELLRIKVFGEEVEDFPPRLEKPAKKIAKNCKGLPLMIVTVADLLSKANKNDDLEFWNEVAENPYSDVMMEAHNQISKELKHIEILGNNLPSDPNSASSLQKLSTLLGVNIRSCTPKVLERLPNIRKLGIQIELTPSGDDDHDLNFGCIWKLTNLEILKCNSIVHPEVKYGCVAPQKPLSMFPSSLRKLHLSGLGYPWKYMKAIGEIPNLQVLKLRCYAFKGPKWETENKSFLHLKYLVIEDTDLVQWKLRYGTFPELCKLRMKHCYKLHKFNWPCDSGSGRIELVDCNPLAVTCAKQLKSKHPSLQVNASFDGKELN